MEMMDATTIGIIGAIATIAAVVITHVLSQQSGEKRANHVREELIGKIDALDRRITETRAELRDAKEDLKGRIADARSETTSQSMQIRSELNTAATHLRESLSSEMKLMKAEILSALPSRSKTVGGEHH